MKEMETTKKTTREDTGAPKPQTLELTNTGDVRGSFCMAEFEPIIDQLVGLFRKMMLEQGKKVQRAGIVQF